MARRQKSRNKPVLVPPAASAVQTPAPGTIAKPQASERLAENGPAAGSPSRTISRRAFLIAATLGALWIAALAALAVFTANPITLNREQIMTSDAVVTARVLDPAAGTVAVEKVWKSRTELTAERLALDNLDKGRIRAGALYLVPLSRVRADRYEVTRTQLPNQQPLVYPATDDAVRQLEAILKSQQ